MIDVHFLPVLGIELGLLVLFQLIAFEADALRSLGIAVDFYVNELHHAYLGCVMVVVGIVLGCEWLALVGVAVTADDVWQHWKQVVMGQSGYRSLLHKLYGWLLWPLEWVQRVNEWLDNLLRRLK
jgi:hypothetical protein